MENILLWLKNYTSRNVQDKQTFYVYSIKDLIKDIKRSLNSSQIKEIIKELGQNE